MSNEMPIVLWKTPQAKIIEGTNTYGNNAFKFKLGLHLEHQHVRTIGTNVPP
jgi:hypothetical protein